MIRDALGNELKVGDHILVGMQGMQVVEITYISEGGLSVAIPGFQGPVLTKGMIKIKMEQELPFDPQQVMQNSGKLGFFKVNKVEDKTDLEVKDPKETKKEHGPN